jgi:hypothetical protein
VDDPVNRVDAWGLAGTKSIGVSVNGSVPGFGAATGIGASGGITGQVTNAKQIDDLVGAGWQVGGAGGGVGKNMFRGGFSIGSDKVGGDNYDGTSVSVNYGVGNPGIYAYKTNTVNLDLDSFPKLPIDLSRADELPFDILDY